MGQLSHPNWGGLSCSQVLKPQDSFGELKKKILIFRKCRKSSENTIRPSCNRVEWHIVMQYCTMANYHYIHNLWQSVRGVLRTFLCFGYFLRVEAFRSELSTGHYSSYNPINFRVNINIYINFHFRHVPKLSIGFKTVGDFLLLKG